MNRAMGGLLAVVVGAGALTSGCSAADAEYCAALPGYFKAAGENLTGLVDDQRQLKDWAAAVEETAALAPDELKQQWDSLTGYAEQVGAAGADAVNAITPDEVKELGKAGKAVANDAAERCGLGAI